MIGNISILICSFVFVCVVSYYLVKMWPNLDVFDLYVIFVLFHFGVYPFIRGLHFGRDVILDLRDGNPIVIGLVFIHVLLILTVIKMIYRYFPDKFVECLKIINLIQKWSLINKYILFVLYGFLIIFQLFSYYNYGIKSYILPADFERIGKDLPYWFTSIRTVFAPLAFLVCLGLISSLLKSKGYYRYIWLILTIAFLPVVTLHGRRFFLAVIMIWTILWLVEKRKDAHLMKYLAVGLFMALVFLLCSNIFQAYRDDLQDVGHLKLTKLKNPFTAAINFEATLENLKARPGTWEFNFLIFDHQFSKPRMTTNGKITGEGIKSVIPKIIWPEKKFMMIDEVLGQLYRVKPKEIDIGKNLFGVVQVEIGFFSLIIVPLIIVIILAMMAALSNMTINYPTYLWLFSVNILYFLINIEENGNEIFYMLRNIGLIFMIFCGYRVAHKMLELRTPKVRESF